MDGRRPMIVARRPLVHHIDAKWATSLVPLLDDVGPLGRHFGKGNEANARAGMLSSWRTRSVI